MEDLTTIYVQRTEIDKIENSFLCALKNNGFDISPDAVCHIDKSGVELGIAATGAYMDRGFKIAFASGITLYASEPDNIFSKGKNAINFGSTGMFTPEVKESYWRTIHAASILKNWDLASNIVNTHCKMYADLWQLKTD